MKTLLTAVLFVETTAFVLGLVLLIPAGMFFDGGCTFEAWAGFLLVASLPLTLLGSILLALRLQKRHEIGPALRATALPLIPLALLPMAALVGF